MRNIFRILITLSIASLITILLFAANLYYGIDDGYAQRSAASLLINYMEDNNGKWPPSWEALEEYFNCCDKHVGGTFDAYRERLFIDFKANADDLRQQSIKSSTVPFRVLYARWTFGMEFGNAELYEYFRRKAGIVKPVQPVSANGPRTVSNSSP